MQWKFWSRTKSAGDSANGAGVKLSRPKELPQQLGGYLVVQKKLDPDWVWALRCVLHRYPGSGSYSDFRIFDPQKAREAGLKVVDFKSLDDHPELILYRGRYDKYNPNAEFDMDPTLDKAA